MSIPDTSGHSLWDFDSSFERPLRCLTARAAHGVMACCLRPPKSPSRKLQVTWRKSPIVGDDVLIERYKIPPHLLFYSEVNGARSTLISCNDETGDYDGLAETPPDGWDEVRDPFTGANKDWKKRRENHRRANSDRDKTSENKLRAKNVPWRSPEGNTEWSLSEMNAICK